MAWPSCRMGQAVLHSGDKLVQSHGCCSHEMVELVKCQKAGKSVQFSRMPEGPCYLKSQTCFTDASPSFQFRRLRALNQSRMNQHPAEPAAHLAPRAETWFGTRDAEGSHARHEHLRAFARWLCSCQHDEWMFCFISCFIKY